MRDTIDALDVGRGVGFISMKPKESKWKPVWGLLSYLPILVVTALIMILPITLILNWLGYPVVSLAEASRSAAGSLRQTISVALTLCTVIGGTWVWQKYVVHRGMTAFGFSLRPAGALQFAFGVGVAFLMMTGIFLVSLNAGWIQVTGFVWSTRAVPEFLASGYIVAVYMLGVAVLEEFIFRGWLLQSLERLFNLRIAVIVSSAIFGAVHLFNSSATSESYASIFVNLSIFGAIMAFAYLLERSLWIPIGLHWAWNFINEKIFSLTDHPVEEPMLVLTKATGPKLWIGTSNTAFGSEIALISTLVMLAAAVALWFAARRVRSSQTRLET